MVFILRHNRVHRSYFGGKNLDEFFGVENPSVSQFPEEWVASITRAFNPGREDIIEGYSYCTDGTLLKDIVEKSPIEMLGAETYRKYGNSIPFLLKILDSAERLFIQCHPTIEFAKEFFGSKFGKTECWYIISAQKDACVYLGFKEGVTRDKWVTAFEKQDIESMLEMLHKVPVKPGDTVFVDGGMPHAIGKGCFLIEAQEPTDLMVIPERCSLTGIKLSDQKMHAGLGFSKMFDMFDYTNYSFEELKCKYVNEARPKKNECNVIVNGEWTDKFKLSQLLLEGSFVLKKDDYCCAGIVLEGQCEVFDNNQKLQLKKGDEFFVSANTESLHFIGTANIILCQ